MRRDAASLLAPLISTVLPGGSPVRLAFWDGSSIGPDGSNATVAVRSPDALRRLLWSPNELGFGRAYVAGDIDVEGDLYEALTLRDAIDPETGDADLSLGWRGWWHTARAARSLGALGRPLPAPAEEASVRGRRHSAARDAAAIAHHYDVSNDFYRLVLGPTMTYSCAYFEHEHSSLDDAQTAKYELICRKLGLEPGMRLLDVGCGWGGMVLHAAARHGVTAVGVTISEQQAALARSRVEQAGLSDRVTIRLQDYRDIDDGPFDAISSIGMFEHVGLERLGEYFERLFSLLRPEGRLLNHAISRPWAPQSRPRFSRTGFIDRYVFPDGELHEVGSVVTAMQQHGFEVRDVESLREHYARTLRAWVDNLESGWDAAVDAVGEARARVWRLYMAASALNFEANRTQIHQCLGVRTTAAGSSGMPPTRRGLFDVDLRTDASVSPGSLRGPSSPAGRRGADLSAS